MNKENHESVHQNGGFLEVFKNELCKGNSGSSWSTGGLEQPEENSKHQ